MAALAISALIACSPRDETPSEPTRTPIPAPSGDSDTPRPAGDQDSNTPVEPTGDATPSNPGIAVGEPTPGFSPISLPTRKITFNLTAPANTPSDDPIFLTIMDMASGFAERLRMKNLGGGSYETQADVLDNAMIRYTYDRF